MTTAAVSFSVVAMKDVPTPPVNRSRKGAFNPVYEAMRKAGFGESHAVCLATRDQKHLLSVRAQLRKHAERNNLVLCSSRDADYTRLYVWLVKKPS